MQNPTQWLVGSVLILCGVAGPAWAQQLDAPPGPFVVDTRLALPSFSTGEPLATPLGLRTDQLPSRGLGVELGAHVYPIRGRRVSLGLGATLLRTMGERAPDETDLATAPTIETRFSAFTPHLSLNFGGARGWSYISAGLSWSRRSTGNVDLEIAEGTRLSGLHYGGGARWFFSRHVGFTFDLRFYRLPAQVADGLVPDQPAYTMFLGSAGLAFK